MRPITRRLPGVQGAVGGLAAVLVAATAASAQSRLQANQQAARRDVRQLLTRLQLPAGEVTPIRSVPRFATSFGFNSSPRGTYYAGARRADLTSDSPEAILAYVKKHPPAGSTANPGTGSSSDSKTGVHSVDVQFSWPDVPEQLLNRSLTVTVVTPPHGRSVLIAQSQSAAYVPRPSSERVPAGVHAVAITVRLGPALTGPVVKPGGKVHTSTHVISSSDQVRALVNTFNALPIVQPAAQPLGCPMILTGSSASELTLAFERGRRGATLARAQVFIHRGRTWEDGGGACDPIEFWIGGRQQTALTSATFVKQIGKLVGADIS